MYKITGGPAPWYAPQVRVHDSGALLLLTEDRSEVLRIIAPSHWYEAILTEEEPPKTSTAFFQGMTWQYTEEMLTLKKIPLIKELRTLNSTGLTETKAFSEYLEDAGIYKNPDASPGPEPENKWAKVKPVKLLDSGWLDDDGDLF